MDHDQSLRVISLAMYGYDMAIDLAAQHYPFRESTVRSVIISSFGSACRFLHGCIYVRICIRYRVLYNLYFFVSHHLPSSHPFNSLE